MNTTVLALLALSCGHRPETPPTLPERAVPTVAERLGDRPFLLPIDAPPELALLTGGTVPTQAATCGACHPDHYAEWAGSTHAHATRDLQFTAELAKPGQPRWLCLSCHAPTRPQRRERIEGTTRFVDPDRIDRVVASAEPTFDPEREAEGVTCAACHVRRDADGQGLVLGPRGSGRAPHRVRRDPEALWDGCSRCHAPSGEPISPTLVCWFDTAQEIAQGPTPSAGCPECHMPQTSRPAAAGGPVETVRRHLWLGGGVPKEAEGYDRALAAGWLPALDVSVAADPIAITLTNARAAHAVPTADPERHLVVEARLESASGEIVARDALRVGQRWDWGDEATGRIARRLDDNRLGPAETRTWTPTLTAPGAAALVVEVTHVRLTEEHASGMRAAALDPELLDLHPAAARQLPEIERFYPLQTVIFRERVSLAGGERIRTPLSELLAESEGALSTPR